MAGRARGGLESEVLACVAASATPVTAAEVQAELSTDLAYTTVLTALARLHEKRVLQREPRGRAYAYSLAGGEAGPLANAAAHQMHRWLDEGEDRAGVLTRFVADLDPADERVLRELLGRGRGKP
jgi:predicted transcriptional regulator